MHVEHFSDAAAFLTSAEAWLLADEVGNNVMLTIAKSVADGTRQASEPLFFAVAQEDATIHCCAMQTPPHRLLLTQGSHAGATALASSAFSAARRLPGVVGPIDVAHAFAETWRQLAGGDPRVSMRQRLHKIAHVNEDLPRVSGVLRAAELADRGLALAWIEAFASEALPGEPHETEHIVDRHLKARSLYFWDDGDGPVSMCASAGVAGGVARINAVYTPPDRRGQGLATAAVAALTRKLLAAGSRYCCLYTDLGNPTSNRVYHRIGYRPVCDMVQYDFS